MTHEELLQKAVGLRQQSEEIEKQLGFVNIQIKELEDFTESLKCLEDDENKEILANLGRGVFVKADRKKEDLFVDVGAGVVVRKTPKETREIIKEQINKFKEAKLQFVAQLEEYASEFRKMLREIEKIKREKN